MRRHTLATSALGIFAVASLALAAPASAVDANPSFTPGSATSGATKTVKRVVKPAKKKSSRKAAVAKTTAGADLRRDLFATQHLAALNLPLLKRPAAMTTSQWYEVNPHFGMSFAQQANAFTNGLTKRQAIGRVLNGSTFSDQHGQYSSANWTMLADRLTADVSKYAVNGLARWYDKDLSNDAYMGWDSSKTYLTRAWKVAGFSFVLPGKTFDADAGFNPNHFDSLADQDDWVTKHGVLIHNDPFPEHRLASAAERPNRDVPDPMTNYEALSSGTFLYSDGQSAAPLTGGWEQTWATLKETTPGFDASSGYSPYTAPEKFVR